MSLGDRMRSLRGCIRVRLTGLIHHSPCLVSYVGRICLYILDCNVRLVCSILWSVLYRKALYLLRVINVSVSAGGVSSSDEESLSVNILFQK